MSESPSQPCVRVSSESFLCSLNVFCVSGIVLDNEEVAMGGGEGSRRGAAPAGMGLLQQGRVDALDHKDLIINCVYMYVFVGVYVHTCGCQWRLGECV